MGLEPVDTACDAKAAEHTAPSFGIRLVSGTNHQGIGHPSPSTDSTPDRVLDVDEVVSHRPSLPHLLHRVGALSGRQRG